MIILFLDTTENYSSSELLARLKGSSTAAGLKVILDEVAKAKLDDAEKLILSAWSQGS